MSAALAIRWSSEADLPGLNEFLVRHYPAGHPLRDARYFDFWFRRDSGEPGVILAVFGSCIVGIQGIIRRALWWRGTEYSAAWYCNTFITPEYRQKGIGLRLLTFSVEACPNLLTLSYSDEAGALLQRLGFSFFGSAGLRRFCRLLSAERYASLPNIVSVDPHMREVPPKRPSAAIRVRSAERILERMWQHSRDEYGLMTSRTIGELRERYFMHPAYEYHVLLIPDHPGCAVIRFEPQPRPIVARIVDWWGPPSAAVRMFEEAAAYAAQESACFVDFFTTSRALDASLAEAGFEELRGEQAWKIPYLFNPPVRRDRYNERFAARLSQLPSGGPATADDIYFVKADGDRDR